MGLAIGRNVDAQPVRRLGLSDAGNIVVLALDREQGDAADAAGIDRPSRWVILPFGSAWRTNTVSTVCR